MHKLKEQDRQILITLKDFPQGLFLSNIIKFSHLTADVMPNIFRTMKRLVREGYAIKKDRLYIITQRGLEEVTSAPRLVSETDKSTYSGTAHKFGLAYPLKDALDARQPPKLFQLAGLPAQSISLQNNEQAQFRIGEITIRLTSRSLLLFTKELYTDNRTPSIEAELAIKHRFDALALEYEARLEKVARFRLKRIDKDTLESHIVTQHWAEQKHPLAEAGSSNSMVLAKSPIDGQRRLGWDVSKGPREAELYHHLTADTDKDALDEQFNMLLDGKIDLRDIPEIKAIVMQQAELYEGYKRQIELHLKVMRKIDQKLSQKRLFP
jgi:hypothetical protein